MWSNSFPFLSGEALSVSGGGESGTNHHPKGVFTFDGTFEVTKVTSDDTSFLLSNSIHDGSPLREIHLHADTPEDRQLWMDYIKRVIAVSRNVSWCAVNNTTLWLRLDPPSNNPRNDADHLRAIFYEGQGPFDMTL